MRLAVLAPALIVLATSGPSAQPSFPDAALAAAALPRLHSLLISHRGTLVFERYYNNKQAAALANVKSVSKSIISALVGIAIQQGRIRNVHDPISPYFTDVLRAQADAAKREITIEDLLTMRSGFESTSSENYGRWVRSSNWVRHTLTRPLKDPPGFVPRGKSDYSDQMYGYGWWMRELAGEQAYYAWGFGGQYIFVIPRLQLVVVTTSSIEIAEERRRHRRSVLGLVEELIIAPLAAS